MNSDPKTDAAWDDETPALDHLTAPARERLYADARAAGGEAAHLRTLDLQSLRDLAAAAGIEVRPDQDRQQLQFLLMQQRLARTGIGLGSGILEVLPDGFGFLRASEHDFRPGPDDVYVSPSQIHRLGLTTGHEVHGPVRLPRRGEQYLALMRVESVDDAPVAELRRRVPFDQATAVLPRKRLWLAPPDGAPDVRLVELLSPWGLGQRVLLQAPPMSGRTQLLVRLVAAAVAGNPALRAIVCLLDERPEDVTVVRRSLAATPRCCVVATTFAEPPVRHLAVADLALARAQRLVERGCHVLLAVDSLTALVRASQLDLPQATRNLAPGLAPSAFLRAKRLFAAARNLEGGASLTVLATALCGTDARNDSAIVEEFAGKGNADVVLDRDLVTRRVFPALDALRTATRREDLLLDPPALRDLRDLRTRLAALSPEQRIEHLTRLLALAPDAAGLRGALRADAAD